MSSKVTRWALASLAAVPFGTPATAQTSATKQAAVSCPERLQTMAATPANPTQVSGFENVIGGATSSQNFLQDIAIQAGSDAPLKGRADGKQKITWTFDGTTEVKVSCIYEGGVSLTRSIGRPKSCAATVKRSKDYPGKANGWGMDSASLRCR